MATGLRIWGADGIMRVDLTTRISKVLGSFNTGTVNGSVTVPVLPGTVFFTQSTLSPNGNKGKLAAVVYNGGGNFSWVFSYDSGQENFSADSIVHYGVY